MTDLVQITTTPEEAVDLNQAYWRRTVADRVKEEFDAYSLSKAGDGFRDHLGASVIGNECPRYLWYHFRWFKKEILSARMHSLFDQGHRIEKQVRETLEARGAEFYYPNPNNRDIQMRFSAVEGHFGGSIDGVFRWPAVGIVNWALLECKSSKTGSPFNDLAKKTVVGANPRHFAQQCTYGKAFGIRYACYIVYNKNDSSLYIEIVDLDWMRGEEMARKAEHIITSKEAPPKISDRPSYYLCKMCNMYGICHGTDNAVANCRNCVHSQPVENAQWKCNHWNSIIPHNAIPNGCPSHKFLTY